MEKMKREIDRIKSAFPFTQKRKIKEERKHTKQTKILFLGILHWLMLNKTSYFFNSRHVVLVITVLFLLLLFATKRMMLIPLHSIFMESD